MPDVRRHRGPHPEDARLFAPERWPALRAACDDFCWLLDRGYAAESALKLVGDRHALVARQRVAVARCACATAAAAARRARQVPPAALRDRPLWIDGYNALTTIEAALGGGVLLAARDGTLRDMASMHGSYRKVAETRPALEMLGETLAELGPAEYRWLLDRPVSNSGRLRQLMAVVAAARGWNWQVDLADSPDRVLIAAAGESPAVVVATADSAILDRCGAWFNLARETLGRRGPVAASDLRLVAL
jgi:hypothetical protein